MPSKLLRSALKSLPQAGWRTLVHFGAWLKGYRGTAPKVVDGKRMLRNLLREAHLVGDSMFADATELSGFLRCCAARLASGLSPTIKYLPCYEEVCARFEGRGLRVRAEHLPDRLLRYSTSVRLLDQLVEELKVGDLVQNDVWQDPETAFEEVCRKWDPSQVKTAMLGSPSKLTVFATFEHEHAGELNREDAVAVGKALGLLIFEHLSTGEYVLFEFSYSRDAVKDPRFPTVADAGWNPSFRPAGEREPDPKDPSTWWGWTRPVEPYPPQPEIVHDNASLRIVKDKPRWVGRIRA